MLVSYYMDVSIVTESIKINYRKFHSNILERNLHWSFWLICVFLGQGCSVHAYIPTHTSSHLFFSLCLKGNISNSLKSSDTPPTPTSSLFLILLSTIYSIKEKETKPNQRHVDTIPYSPLPLSLSSFFFFFTALCLCLCLCFSLSLQPHPIDLLYY